LVGNTSVSKTIKGKLGAGVGVSVGMEVGVGGGGMAVGGTGVGVGVRLGVRVGTSVEVGVGKEVAVSVGAEVGVALGNGVGLGKTTSLRVGSVVSEAGTSDLLRATQRVMPEPSVVNVATAQNPTSRMVTRAKINLACFLFNFGYRPEIGLRSIILYSQNQQNLVGIINGSVL